MLEEIKNYPVGSIVEIPCEGRVTIIRHSALSSTIRVDGSTKVDHISLATLGRLIEEGTTDPNVTIIGCDRHPIYRGQRRPKNGCKGCMSYYEANGGKGKPEPLGLCPDHPNYQARRRPRSGCLYCFRAYNDKHPKQIEGEGTEVKKKVVKPGVLCKDHPAFRAMRRPRSGCVTCMRAYNERKVGG